MSLIERCNGQSASGNACNTVASLTKNFLEFAGMLQMPRKTFRRLQRRCKCPEKLFGLCRDAASAPKNFLEFAGTLQVSRKTFRRLQECCKCPEKLFGVCRNAASVPKNFLAFAGTLQVLRKKLSGVCNTAASIFQRRFSPLRDLRRTSLLALFLCRTHANKKLFRIY